MYGRRGTDGVKSRADLVYEGGRLPIAATLKLLVVPTRFDCCVLRSSRRPVGHSRQSTDLVASFVKTASSRVSVCGRKSRRDSTRAFRRRHDGGQFPQSLSSVHATRFCNPNARKAFVAHARACPRTQTVCATIWSPTAVGRDCDTLQECMSTSESVRLGR